MSSSKPLVWSTTLGGILQAPSLCDQHLFKNSCPKWRIRKPYLRQRLRHRPDFTTSIKETTHKYTNELPPTTTLTPVQAELLRSEIHEKSSSTFLWVVLVVDILNSEYPNSSVSIKKIRERLKEIPPKLTDLFEMILTRDGENLEQLQVCLTWILFATRPLMPQELYFAIQLGLDKECSSCWDQEDVELDQMKTFVRSSSKGLGEGFRQTSWVMASPRAQVV